MSVVGFIVEYNPFHLGHKYHLEESKKSTNSNFSIAIMSGSFLQRGEPAFIDKWSRAKMAIDNGVDLVLELPFIFSSQSAELFAYGGVKLMDSLNIVDYISFGSESGELQPLKLISTILANEPEYYTNRLRHYLGTGMSFAASRSKALIEYINYAYPNDNYDYKNIIQKSNNILAIEYIKALIKINSKIKPCLIRRLGSDYNEINLTNGFASATAIRHRIKQEGILSIKELVPLETYYLIEEYLHKYNSFNSIENYSQIILYLLRTIDKKRLASLMDIEAGLENRLINEGYKNNNIPDLINGVVTKRYPRSRIQRLLIHLINELDGCQFKGLYGDYPSYIRVLGASKNGLILLNRIKENSHIPIITKFANYKNYQSTALEEILYFDKKSTDIFFLGVNSPKVLSNMDYLISPYIK